MYKQGEKYSISNTIRMVLLTAGTALLMGEVHQRLSFSVSVQTVFLL